MTTGSSSSSTMASLSSGALGSVDSAPAIFVHPAAAVCVKTHVPFTVEVSSNYNKWVSYFKVLCGKFSLRPHIDGVAPACPTDHQWVIADSCVKSWLFNSVGDSVLDLVLTGDDQTARDLWVAIEELFTANQEPRAVLLEEFHTTTQGDSTVSQYCQHIKLKAAELRAIGHPVEVPSLVLAMLRGLNKCFASTVDDITNSAVLPSFSRAHDMLVLKETRLANDEKSAANTALLASAGAGCSGPGGCRSSTAGASPGGSSGGSSAPQKNSGGSVNKKKGGGFRKGNGGGSGGGGSGVRCSPNSLSFYTEDVAKSYFVDLVNRNLVQPEDTNYMGEVLSCRVHDMMLDFIISKCKEDNFISVIYNSQGMTELHNTKVRRLSLKLNGEEGGTTSASGAIGTKLPVRSLALFGDTSNSWYHHEEVEVDLTGISQLFLLRYLKINAAGSLVKLPTEIRGLHHLETLEMCCEFVGGIPLDIFHLPALLHLTITSHSGIPDGIVNAKSLCSLQYFDLMRNSLENIQGLGELMNLRVLTIRCFQNWLLDTAVGRSSLDALRLSLGKLGSRNLRYLSVVRYPVICADPLSSLTLPPQHLETLDLLAWWFSRVSKWLAQLHNLCSLDLCVSKVMEEDVVILGALPSLIHLQFKVQEAPKEKIIIHAGAGVFFTALQNFQFKCERRLSVQLLKFDTGAMPSLRRLEIETSTTLLQRDGCMPAGIEHLLNLKEICLSILHRQGTESERIAAESAIRNIAQAHPSSPTITIV
ncbi:hypothetical protein ACP4OV_029524 [Aristida adscensionis]